MPAASVHFQERMKKAPREQKEKGADDNQRLCLKAPLQRDSTNPDRLLRFFGFVFALFLEVFLHGLAFLGVELAVAVLVVLLEHFGATGGAIRRGILLGVVGGAREGGEAGH